MIRMFKIGKYTCTWSQIDESIVLLSATNDLGTLVIDSWPVLRRELETALALQDTAWLQTQIQDSVAIISRPVDPELKEKRKRTFLDWLLRRK